MNRSGHPVHLAPREGFIWKIPLAGWAVTIGSSFLIWKFLLGLL